MFYDITTKIVHTSKNQSVSLVEMQHTFDCTLLPSDKICEIDQPNTFNLLAKALNATPKSPYTSTYGMAAFGVAWESGRKLA